MLLPDSYFKKIFNPLKNKKVFYLPSAGNVGDDLISAGAYQLFNRFKIELTDDFDNCDVLAIAGGGNFGGSLYKFEEEARFVYYRKIEEQGKNKEIYIFPQSIKSIKVNPPDFITKVFVRDNESLKVYPNAELAPDLALGFDYTEENVPPKYKVGVLLREDKEAKFASFYKSDGDPASVIPRRHYTEYIKLAMNYEQIYTDRLHFAISGLIIGRDVTLLPNSYWKNRSMWETWLKDLGCKWANKPPSNFRLIPNLYKVRLLYKSVKWKLKSLKSN